MPKLWTPLTDKEVQREILKNLKAIRAWMVFFGLIFILSMLESCLRGSLGDIL